MNPKKKVFFLIAFLLLFSVSVQAVSLVSAGEVHTVSQGNLVFETNGNGLVKLYKNDDYLASFGFTLKGTVNEQQKFLNSWSTNWTWQVLSNTDSNVTVLGSTDWQGLEWKQRWFFSDSEQKFANYLTNNTGFDVTNTGFYYVVRFDSINVPCLGYSDNIGNRNNYCFEQDKIITQNLGQYLKRINFVQTAFNFQDLIDSGFEFNYLFAGQLNNVNPSLFGNGFIVGVTKNGGLFPNGASVVLDPTIKTGLVDTANADIFDAGSPNVFRVNATNLGFIANATDGAFFTRYYESVDNGLNWSEADFNFYAKGAEDSPAIVFNPDNNKVVLVNVFDTRLYAQEGDFDNNLLTRAGWDNNVGLGFTGSINAQGHAIDINSGNALHVCGGPVNGRDIECRYVDTDLNTSDISNWSALESSFSTSGNLAAMDYYIDSSDNGILLYSSADGTQFVSMKVRYDVNGSWSNDLNLTADLDSAKEWIISGNQIAETEDGNLVVLLTTKDATSEAVLRFCDDGAEACVSNINNWDTYRDIYDSNFLYWANLATRANDVFIVGTDCSDALCNTNQGAQGLNYRIFFDLNKTVSAKFDVNASDSDATIDSTRFTITANSDTNGLIDLVYFIGDSGSGTASLEYFPILRDGNLSILTANFEITVHTEDFDPEAINLLLVDFNSITTIIDTNNVSYNWLVDSVSISTDENVQQTFSTGSDRNVSLIVTGRLNDLNVLFSSQKDLNLSLIVPEISVVDFNVTSQLSVLDINAIGSINVRCTTGVASEDLNYIVGLNDVNVFDQAVDDDFDLHLVDQNFSDIGNTIVFTCIGESGLSSNQTITFDVFIKNFFFVFDNTGVVVPDSTEYATADINSVFVYSFDNNVVLDLFTDGKVSFNASGDVNTAIQIRIGYDDPTFPFTSRDFELKVLDVNSVPVCHSRLQTFYQNVFFSSVQKQIRLINANTGCYHFAATTKFAFADTLSVPSFLVPQSYNLFLLGSDGDFSVLAVVDGSSAGQINIDALIIKRSSALEINIPAEAATIQKGCGEADDCNTFVIRYKNTKANNSKAVATVFNGLLPVFTHTETDSPNDFAVTFDATDLNFFDGNVLKLTVVTTRTDGSTKTFTIFFTPQGKVGFIDPAIAVILSFVIFIGGISLVSARIVFGWFGAIVALIALAFLSFSVEVWWLSFMQAIMLSMLLYIGITFSQSQQGAA